MTTDLDDANTQADTVSVHGPEPRKDTTAKASRGSVAVRNMLTQAQRLHKERLEHAADQHKPRKDPRDRTGRRTAK